MASLSRATVSQQWNTSLSLVGPEVSGQKMSPNALNPSISTYTPTSTVPVTQYLAEEVTIAGDITLTLDAWTDVEGASKSSAALKVQAIRIHAESTNSAAVTVQGGAADPYELFGSGNAVDFEPGSRQTFEFADQLDDVGPTSGGGATDIKISGTDGDVLNIEMLIG